MRRQRPRDPTGRPLQVRDFFGSHTFGLKEMRERLPGAIVDRFVACVEHHEKLDHRLADAIASAALQWVIEHGATHFCHWFQPMTGLTAEKHDGFLVLSQGQALAEFTGAQLIQSEPDASSFPSGGIRSTFEARGYTVWDPSSPMYIAERVNGATLCIPSCFFSYTGEALDKKIPLLRSMEALEAQALRLCRLLGDRATRARITAGPEQEYFLVDRAWAALRPDLIAAGRTLLGQRAPKGQSLDDHYFGSIPARVQAFMNDLEIELYRLGVPAKTRHNEVAPSQFELAVLYSEGHIATDHNQLVMELLKKTAEKHDLMALLHEKPFAGVNGSGKHLNWSIAIDGIGNVLEPGDTPHANTRFLAFLAGIITGVHRHAGLLRASIASHGNDFRLGANEAPPAIISVFLGDQLGAIVRSLAEGRAVAPRADDVMRELGVSRLPSVMRDNTDRNRTSPFAFTGNKFEFRAVGSRSSIAFPLTSLNTAVADGIASLCDRIESGDGRDEAVLAAIRESLAEALPVCFEGNNYSEDWVEEARARGLPHLRRTPEALAQLRTEPVRALFQRHRVLSESELEARYQVKLDQYITQVEIEADIIRDMVDQFVLPAAIAERTAIAGDLAALQAVGEARDEDRAALHEFSQLLTDLRRARAHLDEVLVGMNGERGQARAEVAGARVQPAIEALRAAADALEARIADARWTLPRYREMLFQN
ncbi:MAG: glutamine synthetase type III [Deltaproteobacteria bacterium]|nr:MAG: glutamine synthetase type III [Deltaproteobacteria bacterium]